MVKIVISLSLSFIFIFSTTSAQAYPIFFACKADHTISNVLTPAELAGRLNALATASSGRAAQAIEEACNGLDDCIRDFTQLVSLARASGGLAREEIVRMIEERAGQSMNSMKGFLRVPAGEVSEPDAVPLG